MTTSQTMDGQAAENGLQEDATTSMGLNAYLSGNTAVTGLQWGDEGKGKIVDLLTEDYDCIIRYNGGANAGHTVVVGDQKYALHLLPSGIIGEGKTNIIGNGVVVDPEKLLDEIQTIRDRGISIGDNLKISDRAHVVMPYHKIQDGLLEAAMSACRNDGKNIGTTGRGIGPCYSDKAARSTAIRVGDLVKPEKLKEKIEHIAKIKNVMLKPLADLAGVEYTPINPEILYEQFLGYGKELAQHITDTPLLLDKSLKNGKRLLFEGANACMLDIDHGTFPFVTSSNCSSLGIYAGSGMPGNVVNNVVGIVKAYTTRVGGGPFATELDNAIGQRIRDRGHEYGTTTGRPRRCGWLDLAVIKYSARICGASALSIMLLDVLAGFETLKVCTGYRYRNEEIDYFPADPEVLEQCEPIYREIEGFAEEITECKSYDELPAQAKAYIELIEEVVGLPVKIVSVGPERTQTLFNG